jgi:hypothetical protein
VKEQLRALLEKRRFEEIVEMAGRRKRVLGVLISLMFDRDALVAWRAVEALGTASERIADENPAFVTGQLRRLHWLLSDESGGICWHAPQAMAEIVRRRPRVFAEYIPIVLSLLVTMEKEDLVHFASGILWAIGRLAPVAGREIEEIAPAVVRSLDSADPQVRGMAVWCLGQMEKGDLLAARISIFSDDGPVELYEDGELRHTSVGVLAHKAVSGCK